MRKSLDLFCWITVETMNLVECCVVFEVFTAGGHKIVYQRNISVD